MSWKFSIRGRLEADAENGFLLVEQYLRLVEHKLKLVLRHGHGRQPHFPRGGMRWL